MPLRIYRPEPTSNWYATGTVAGGRVRRSLKTRSKEAAEALAAELESRLIRQSIYGPERETTFAEAARRFMMDGGEARYMEKILLKIGPKRRLAEMSSAFVRQIARELYPDVKPQTQNRYVVKPVAAVLNFAHREKLGPPIAIQSFKGAARRPRAAASQAWVCRFVQACDEQGHHRLGTLALFMHVTGARTSEALALTPHHFDLGRLLAVSEPTKTGVIRYFHLTRELVERVRKFPALKLTRGRGKGRLLVFPWADNKGPRQTWVEVCKRAGLAYHCPYEAGRHSYATTAVTIRREDIPTAAAAGNWKDARVMLEHYAAAGDIPAFVERNFEGILAKNWQTEENGQSGATVQVVVTERKKA